MIRLDTSFLIGALVPASAEEAGLRRWLAGAEPLGVSGIAWAEFLCGPMRGAAPHLARRLLGEPVAFASDEAELAADLFNRSGRRRGTLAGFRW